MRSAADPAAAASGADRAGAGRHADGFTLIEVLVAMALTGLVSLMAYTNMDAVSRTLAITREKADNVSAVSRVFVLMARDLRQLTPRPARDQFGNYEAAFYGGEVSTPLLALTRSGWSNPRRLPRSALQRVHYLLEGDVLYRQYWHVLDRNTYAEPIKVALLEGVDDVRLRFLDNRPDPNAVGETSYNPLGGRWKDDWELERRGQNIATLPNAVEVTVSLRDWGDIARLYEVPVHP